MSNLAIADDLFFTRAGLERPRVERIVGEALKGADDGELFLEYVQSEMLVFDDGKLKLNAEMAELVTSTTSMLEARAADFAGRLEEARHAVSQSFDADLFLQ